MYTFLQLKIFKNLFYKWEKNEYNIVRCKYMYIIRYEKILSIYIFDHIYFPIWSGLAEYDYIKIRSYHAKFRILLHTIIKLHVSSDLLITDYVWLIIYDLM